MFEETESLWYKMLCVRYGDEGGRLCFGTGGKLDLVAKFEANLIGGTIF